MGITPEIKREQSEATEVPETIEIPEPLEKATGVQATKTQVTAQVTGDSGQNLIQTPVTKPVIQIPADPTTLTTLSQGSVSDAVTWFASFWIRIIKKALKLGMQVVVGRK